MSGQFKDSDLCAACGHHRGHHFNAWRWNGVYAHRCQRCPPEKRCQRFIPRPAGDEKREGAG